jgi:hypothetical protein
MTKAPPLCGALACFLLCLLEQKHITMITQLELPEYIEHEMPELGGICDKDRSRTVYDIVRHMMKYTKSQVIKHNLNAAKKCMALAEQLYHKGNNAIKNAIENVYVYSFSHAFFHDEKERKEIMDIVPPSLYKLYREQVINSHL